jgi:hypothetical protein
VKNKWYWKSALTTLIHFLRGKLKNHHRCNGSLIVLFLSFQVLSPSGVGTSNVNVSREVSTLHSTLSVHMASTLCPTVNLSTANPQTPTRATLISIPSQSIIISTELSTFNSLSATAAFIPQPLTFMPQFLMLDASFLILISISSNWFLKLHLINLRPISSTMHVERET